MKRLSVRETNELAILTADLVNEHDVKSASDMETLADDIHQAIETGLQDYCWDMSKEEGYEDLENYGGMY